jgi:hypothetical protein
LGISKMIKAARSGLNRIRLRTFCPINPIVVCSIVYLLPITAAP